MSRRREEDKWGPHSHCIVCGNAIAEGETTCSEECAKKYDNQANRYKRQKKMNYLFMGGIVGIAILFLLIQLLSKPGG